jgi:hypothetical protein
MKIPLLLLSASILLSGCGESASQPKAMLAENIKCPEGSSPEIERWGGIGENGWLQACKMKHGLFTAWYGEVKAVEGNYINGKEEDVWQFWNKDGKKHKEITYKHGKEIFTKSFE